MGRKRRNRQNRQKQTVELKGYTKGQQRIQIDLPVSETLTPWENRVNEIEQHLIDRIQVAIKDDMKADIYITFLHNASPLKFAIDRIKNNPAFHQWLLSYDEKLDHSESLIKSEFCYVLIVKKNLVSLE
ncbi:MAG TPA: hypothetical protein VIQ31_32135 [Phormidium sp.]